MSRGRRGILAGAGDVIGVGVVVASTIWLGALTGWPQWWISTAAVLGAAGIAVAVIPRVRTVSATTGRLLTAATIMAALAVAGGVVAASVHVLAERDSTNDAFATMSADGGALVCRVVDRGTPAARATAMDTATGDLADRLRSGAGTVDSDTTVSSCTPVQTGVVAASSDTAEIVAAVNVATVVPSSGDASGARDSTVGRVLGAELRRVDGRWLVASVRVLR